MSENKLETNPKGQGERPRRDRSQLFVSGILAGVLITGLVFIKPVAGLLRDGVANVVPVFFTPGILEITLGLAGFGVVVVVNHLLLRREAKDEWVELPDDES